MSVLLIAGSPSERSRSAALLDAVSLRLALRGVRLKLSSILAAEGMTVDDLVHASLTFIRALHGNGSYVLLGKNNHSWKVLKTVTTWVS